jgi:hypothetical protein
MYSRVLACIVVGLAVAVCGCNRDRTAELVGEMNKSNVQRLANLYAAHQNYKSGRGPASESDFREFIKSYDPNKLQMMGINPDALDQLFTSEVDGKPLKVRYGVGGGRGSKDAVVFDEVGANGKRRVGYTGGTVEEVDDATANQLLAGKPKTESTASTGGGPGAKGGKSGRPTGAPAGAPTGPPK